MHLHNNSDWQPHPSFQKYSFLKWLECRLHREQRDYRHRRCWPRVTQDKEVSTVPNVNEERWRAYSTFDDQSCYVMLILSNTMYASINTVMYLCYKRFHQVICSGLRKIKSNSTLQKYSSAFIITLNLSLILLSKTAMSFASELLLSQNGKL